MKKQGLVAGLVTGGMLAASLVTAGGASAATMSQITVTPLEPKMARVCWTDYVPDSGSVIGYQLTVPEISDNAISVPTGNCVDLDSLRTNVWYTFHLEANVLDGGSTHFEVAAPDLKTRGYALGVNLTPSTVVGSGTVTVSGSLHTGRAAKPVPGAVVSVQRRVLPSLKWTLVRKVTTNAKGNYRTSVNVSRNISVRAYFKGLPGGPQTVGTWNSDNDVNVRAGLSIGFSRKVGQVGQRTVVTGKVTKGSKKFLAGKAVCLQRLQKRRWSSLRCVKISRKGTFRSFVVPKSSKDLKYRWHASTLRPRYVASSSRAHRFIVR